MGMTTDGLSYWQAESEGIELLDTTIGDLLDRRAEELPTQEAVVYSCYPEFGDVLNIRWTYQEYRERANQVAIRAAQRRSYCCLGGQSARVAATHAGGS